MYLTDIRGFTAEDTIAIYPARLRGFSMEDPACLLGGGDEILLRGKKHESSARETFPLCRITIHGMGMQGDKGLSLHFARFCRLYDITPRFISMSDMGIAFFVPQGEKDKVLDALCAYFPMWM